MPVESHALNEVEDHDLGLAHDLKVIEAQLMARRRALVMMASAGTVGFLAACGNGSSGGTTTTGSVTATGTTGTTTTTSTTGGTTTTTGGTACTLIPGETAGPFPGDGTNTAPGATSNVLVQSGIVRADIRPGLLGGASATGVLVTLTLTVVNVNATCAPLAGYAVYLWQADRAGQYSLYGSAAAASYLRGIQVTNAQGQVTFTTIYPAAYDGRFPHMHFEVFSSLANATSGRFAVLTSQLAMPDAASAAVYTDATTYPGSAAQAARVTLASDGIFGNNSAAQNAAMTPTFTGSVAAGYALAATIGIAT